MTQETTIPANETAAQRMMREAQEFMNKALTALKEEEDAKAAAIAAEVAEIDGKLTTLEGQIGTLMGQHANLKARRLELVPAPEPQPASSEGAKELKLPSTAIDGATKKYQTEKYMFWKAYQRAYKGQPDTAAHTQAALTAICTAHSIPFMPDVATLSRVRDLLTRTNG